MDRDTEGIGVAALDYSELGKMVNSVGTGGSF